MEVSVVIPTRNRPEDLACCLNALDHQTIRPKEILVINNGEKLSITSPSPLKRVKILESDGPLSYLFNLGWRKSTGDVVAYLNDDSEPEPNWIRGIQRGFATFPAAVAIGGPTLDAKKRNLGRLYTEGSLPIRLAFSFYERAFLGANFLEVGRMGKFGAFSIGTWAPPRNMSQPVEVDHLTITNVAFKKSILETLGGFDEGFFYNHIDGDFFLRLKRLGKQQIFHPEVRVKHNVAPTGPTRDIYFLARDSAYFLFKDFSPSSFRDLAGFVTQLLFVNAFFVYSAVSFGSPRQLRGLFGFVRGIADALS